MPFRYFTADAGYGRDPALRARCHAAAVAYVLAVPTDLPLVEPRGGATRPDRVRAAVPKTMWERRSCGHGTKGERYYDWAAVTVTVKDQPPADRHAHMLLIRRSVSDPSEIEFFLAHAPAHTPIPELIAVAAMRWKIEENNAQGKDLLGLDQYRGAWTNVAAALVEASRMSVEREQREERLLRAIDAIVSAGDLPRASAFTRDVAGFEPAPLGTPRWATWRSCGAGAPRPRRCSPGGGSGRIPRATHISPRCWRCAGHCTRWDGCRVRRSSSGAAAP